MIKYKNRQDNYLQAVNSNLNAMEITFYWKATCQWTHNAGFAEHFIF